MADFDWPDIWKRLPRRGEEADFSIEARAANIARMAKEGFDVVVIGGGFIGSAVALDLSARGVRVALVERGDFAGETSQSSGNIIWGGIKYLANLDIPFVRECIRERNRFLRRAPHIVREVMCLSPVYRGDPYGLFPRILGTWVYYAMGGFSRETRRPGVIFGRSATLRREPRLKPDGLRGAVTYGDAAIVTSDAHLALQMLLAAAANGAVVANYCCVEGFQRDGDRIAAVSLRDVVSGETFAVAARAFVNAAGPWADSLNAQAGHDSPRYRLNLRRGTSLVADPEVLGGTDRPEHHIVSFADGERRLLFFYGWGPRFLIGTTDTDHSPDALGDIQVTHDEVRFLFRQTRARFPGSQPSRDSVIETRVGVRPLAVPRGSLDPTSRSDALTLSRKHRIDSSRRMGLVTVYGGTLSPARRIAEAVARRIRWVRPEVFAGRPFVRKPYLAVYGARQVRTLARIRDIAREENRRHDLDGEVLENVISLYGEECVELFRILDNAPDLKERVYDPLPYTWADLVLAVRNRMVISLDDLLRRRTNIAQWIAQGGLGAGREHEGTLKAIASMLACARGEGEDRARELLSEYEKVAAARNAWRAGVP